MFEQVEPPSLVVSETWMPWKSSPCGQDGRQGHRGKLEITKIMLKINHAPIYANWWRTRWHQGVTRTFKCLAVHSAKVFELIFRKQFINIFFWRNLCPNSADSSKRWLVVVSKSLKQVLPATELRKMIWEGKDCVKIVSAWTTDLWNEVSWCEKTLLIVKTHFVFQKSCLTWLEMYMIMTSLSGARKAAFIR